MSHHTYVLRSLKNGKRYIGFTSKNPAERLADHNAGLSSWTRRYRPWILIYQERQRTKSEAVKRERYLKSAQGRQWLDANIKVTT